MLCMSNMFPFILLVNFFHKNVFHLETADFMGVAPQMPLCCYKWCCAKESDWDLHPDWMYSFLSGLPVHQVLWILAWKFLRNLTDRRTALKIFLPLSSLLVGKILPHTVLALHEVSLIAMGFCGVKSIIPNTLPTSLIHCQPAFTSTAWQCGGIVNIAALPYQTSTQTWISSSLTCAIPVWFCSALSFLQRQSPRSRGCWDTNGAWHPSSLTASQTVQDTTVKSGEL